MEKRFTEIHDAMRAAKKRGDRKEEKRLRLKLTHEIAAWQRERSPSLP